MEEKFYTILTNIGKAKIANSSALGSKVNFAKIKAGDGNGKYYEPTENQIKLVNTVWEGNIRNIEVTKENPNWIEIEAIIPSDEGGFTIREFGVFDEEDNLLAISKCAETYKPIICDGSIKELLIKMVLSVSNTDNVSLKIDPTIVVAKKSDVEKVSASVDEIKSQMKEIANKVDNIKIADGTTTQKGIVQLNNTTNSTSITQAATANAVKLAMDRANEAFTGADNYKKGIAGVIGNPVLDTQNKDETVNSIQSIKNNAVSALKSKNVDANGNEALASLIGKIAQISVQGMGGALVETGSFVLSSKGDIFRKTLSFEADYIITTSESADCFGIYSPFIHNKNPQYTGARDLIQGVITMLNITGKDIEYTRISSYIQHVTNFKYIAIKI